MSAFIERFSSVFICLQLLVLIPAIEAHAQSGAGSGFSGRVADSTGASMAGVTVTVSRPDTGFERTTRAAAGDWEARFLHPAPTSRSSSGIQDASPRERARHDRSDGAASTSCWRSGISQRR